MILKSNQSLTRSTPEKKNTYNISGLQKQMVIFLMLIDIIRQEVTNFNVSQQYPEVETNKSTQKAPTSLL